MLIGGLQKLTLIDYPGKIACAVFTVGCNFRCPFCHNPELVEPAAALIKSNRQTISESEFFDFLKSRQGLLDGVCVTGGEPLICSDLFEFLKQIKNFGFSVKLDTNGAFPDRLKKLMDAELIDYVAMDIKTNIKRQTPNAKTSYEKVAGVKVNLGDIKKSINIIMQSGLDYEFRTTVVPGLHNADDIVALAKSIRKAKRYYLQQFVAGKKMLDSNYQKIKPYPIGFFYQLRDKIKDWFEVCEVRGWSE